MATTLLTPLSIQVPLVDEKGCPTPYFQRLLQQLLKEKAVTDDLAESAVQSARQIISGAGLTGGGDLSADRTLAVGAGTGITVNADDVALDSTYLDERIRDVIGAAVVAGTNMTITVNDGGDTITFASGGGSGSSWSLIHSTDPIPNPTANIDVDVSAYDEIFCLYRSVTLSSTGFRGILPSVDGVTFYKTNGDYTALLNNGGEAATFVAGNHETSASLARTGGAHMPYIRLSGVPKYMRHLNLSGPHRFFVADLGAITHVRLAAMASSGGAYINMTGGAFYVFGK